jgi:hypothetical protein
MVAKGSCLKKFLFKPPVFRMSSRTVEDALAMIEERWSHFLTQPAKVGLPMQRTNHHEDAETVFG